MTSKAWIARVTKDLSAHGYTFQQFKENPFYYIKVNKQYGQNFVKTHPHSNKSITWFNKVNTVDNYMETFEDQSFIKTFKQENYKGNINTILSISRY